MPLKEDDIVMCTVRNIEGTTIFVDIEGNGSGSLVMSEVAAGRIRNLREYVFPNKKIVCKVLKISNGHVELSLRRVTGKEREEALDSYKKEQTLSSILKTVSTSPEKIIEKIKEKYSVIEFLEEAKENPKIIQQFMPKTEADKIEKILLEKKEKQKEAKGIIVLKSDGESGINEIKSTLNIPDIEIKYLGSSKFLISSSAKDFKEANSKIISAMDTIQKRAKENKLFFEIKEK